MGKSASSQLAPQGASGRLLSQDEDDANQNIVEPRILMKQRGKGSKRGKEARDVLQSAYTALWEMAEGSFLSPKQQKAIWPYLTWPPVPQWHILQFDAQQDWNSLGYTVEPDDHTIKRALAGIFQPKRRVYPGQLYYKHLLIPIFFRHQEDGSDVCMWGMIHVQKGKNVAYFHVFTKWQEDIHGTNVKAWSKIFDPQSLFGGHLRGFNMKIVIQVHNGDLDAQAFRKQNDVEEWSKWTFFYSIHVARHLMLLGAADDQIPHFDVQKNGPEGVVQLLVGIHTAFEHAGIQVTTKWPPSKLEEDEDNVVFYRKVCQDMRYAFEPDEVEMSLVSESDGTNEDLDGTTLIDELSPDRATCDETEDDEMI